MLVFSCKNVFSKNFFFPTAVPLIKMNIIICVIIWNLFNLQYVNLKVCIYCWYNSHQEECLKFVWEIDKWRVIA